jgi:hypothetical protein
MPDVVKKKKVLVKIYSTVLEDTKPKGVQYGFGDALRGHSHLECGEGLYNV